VAILGVRIEAHVLWLVKWHYLRLVQRLREALLAPADIVVWGLTRKLSVETRRSWQRRGHLSLLDPLLSRGHLRIPFGLAEGMLLSTAHLDLGGAQTYAMVRGVHEPTVQEALRRTLRSGDVFYDIGANIGITGLAAARLVGRGGHVVSVEPEAANVRALHAHMRLNQLCGWLVIEAAATSRSAPVEVIGVEDSLWTRLASVGEHPHERRRMIVRGVALDDLVASGEAPPPQVIKIDVEGAELDVLEGMGTILAVHRPALVVEMHGKNQAVCELLAQAGYRITNLDGPQAPSEAGEQVHVLAEPA